MSVDSLVSVIIPLYNAERYIEKCIGSILEQTWQNIEVIVVDDGSTDNGVSKIKALESNRVQILSQNNSGASVARNYGLSIARGKYIQFMDADDFLSNKKIEEQVLLLQGNEDCVAVCGTVYFYDGINPAGHKPAKSWYSNGSDDPVDFLLKLYAGPDVMPGYGGMIQPNAWLTPRHLIDSAGMWNEFRCPDDDGEFFSRVLLASKGVRFGPQGINYYRKFRSGNSLSSQKGREALENIFLAIELKYSHLKERTNSELVDNIFARHYWELGVKAFPEYKDISDKAIKQAKKFGYRGVKYRSSNTASFLSRLVGWRTMKILSIIKHRSFKRKK